MFDVLKFSFTENCFLATTVGFTSKKLLCRLVIVLYLTRIQEELPLPPI